MHISPWTTERIKLLAEWRSEGLSSTLIADKFKANGYNVTRNAVIGKLYRLGARPNGEIKQKVRNNGSKLAAVIHRLNNIPAPLRSSIRYKRMKIIIPSPPPQKKEDITMKGAPRTAKRVLLRKTEEGQCRAIIGYANGVLADAICCGEEAPWILNSHGKLTRSPWCQYHRDQYITFDKGRKR